MTKRLHINVFHASEPLPNDPMVPNPGEWYATTVVGRVAEMGYMTVIAQEIEYFAHEQGMTVEQWLTHYGLMAVETSIDDLDEDKLGAYVVFRAEAKIVGLRPR